MTEEENARINQQLEDWAKKHANRKSYASLQEWDEDLQAKLKNTTPREAFLETCRAQAKQDRELRQTKPWLFEPEPERNIMAELFQGVGLLVLIYLALAGLHQVFWGY
jgi:hypothetical protein